MKKKILILEPYYAGSHAAWLDEYAARSRHEVSALTLDGKYWKWRMHGGAVKLAADFNSSGMEPDLIIASDMLDLATFLALAREKTAGVKTAVYFHENQLSYPWSDRDRDPDLERDVHYGFINYTSALAADGVFFNSNYHMNSFLDELGPFLGSFPDYQGSANVSRIREKSIVLPLGLDLSRLDRFRSSSGGMYHRGGRGGDIANSDGNETPLILWNHRWEYDKNPGDFFSVLFDLADEGIDFNVALLGESYSRVPQIFNKAASRLGDRIVHAGFVEDFGKYASWLWRSDLLPVTSNHDFFGASVVQAVYCGCFPLLPRRLAYPEHFPVEYHGAFFYDDLESLKAKMREKLIEIDKTRKIDMTDLVRKYDWSEMAPLYDDLVAGIAGPCRPGW